MLFFPSPFRRKLIMFILELRNKLFIYQAKCQRLMEEQTECAERNFHKFYLNNDLRDVIIDLEGVKVVTSRFISWLLLIRQQASAKNGVLLLCSVSDHVLGQLRRLNLLGLLPRAINLPGARRWIYSIGRN